jgi:hypothetical protein
MQLKAGDGEQYYFLSMNVRMYYPDSLMTFHSITEVLGQANGGFYSYGPPSMTTPALNNVNLAQPIYLEFNIDGIAAPFPGFQIEVNGDMWTTIAEVCFSFDEDIESVMETCQSLVWDLEGDGEGGLQGGSDGVVLLRYIPLDPTPIVALNEEVTQYNWGYLTNITGSPLPPTDGDFICTDIPCAPLAVELSQFNASRSGAKQAKLYWVTESEINNEYFSIQRSKDGIEFEEIGVVKGNGTTSARHAYDMYDNDPYFGMNYYRLIQYDFDGTSASSGIRTVTFEDPNSKGLTVTAQPNPFVKSIRVDYEVEGASQLIVYDAEGTLINTFDFDGRVRHEIDLEGYPAGMYVVKVINGEDEQVVKVMKAN